MFTVAFGKSIMSRTQVQLWHNWFKEGDAVKKTVVSNHRITIREVAEDVGISFG